MNCLQLQLEVNKVKRNWLKPWLYLNYNSPAEAGGNLKPSF